MQCVRCQHPLPPRADRCLRCFALNPQNRPEPLAVATPATPLGVIKVMPLELSFESDPPPQSGGVGALSIRSDPPPRDQPDLRQSATAPRPPLESGPGEPVFTAQEQSFTPLEDPEFAFAEPGLAAPPRLVIDLGQTAPPPPPDTIPAPPPSGMVPAPAPGAAPRTIQPPEPTATPPREPALQDEPPSSIELPLRPDPSAAASPDLAGLALPARPSPGARLLAWAVDGAAIALASLLFVGIAAALLGRSKLAPLGAQSWQSWADGLFFAQRLPIFWGLLAATLALVYSWLFAALGGRTPGLRAVGLELRREDGAPLDPVQALVRALLTLPSAALCLFGFLLALVDPRGQTLHDRLSRSLLVVSGGARRGS